MDRKYLLQDLADVLSSAEKIKKKDAEDFLRAYFSLIEDGLLKDKIVKISDLGSFKLIKADARTSVDVNTGQSFLIKEHFKLSYNPDTTLKELINKPFAGFEPVETEMISQPKEILIQTVPEKPEIQLITNPKPKDILENKEEIVSSETDDQIEYDIEEIESIYASKQKIPNEERKSSLNNIFYEISENSVIPDNLPDTPELMHKEIAKVPKPVDGKKWKYAFWIFLTLIIAFIIFWTIKSNIDAKKDFEEKKQVFDKFLYERSKQPVKTDTLSVIKYDSIDNQKDTVLIPKVAEQKVDYPIYILIHPAENLMTLSIKYYGHKSFWVYIYLDNKDVIKNPNDITVGRKIKISKPDPTKTNPNDPECIRKAGVLQYQIMSDVNSTSSMATPDSDSTL